MLLGEADGSFVRLSDGDAEVLDEEDADVVVLLQQLHENIHREIGDDAGLYRHGKGLVVFFGEVSPEAEEFHGLDGADNLVPSADAILANLDLAVDEQPEIAGFLAVLVDDFVLLVFANVEVFEQHVELFFAQIAPQLRDLLRNLILVDIIPASHVSFRILKQ